MRSKLSCAPHLTKTQASGPICMQSTLPKAMSSQVKQDTYPGKNIKPRKTVGQLAKTLTQPKPKARRHIGL